jgi:geranylgeranyl diphosphate synthase type I
MDVSASIYTSPAEALDQDHFMRLYNAKTAVYSFCTPLRLGALLAGAGAAADKQLNAYGHHLGIAFQLRDDILGIFGDEIKMGKSTLSDIREGRRTMLMSFGLDKAKESQKRALERMLGNPKATYDDLKIAQTILKSTGALHQVEVIMHQHCDEARNILLTANFPMTLNPYLADLLAFSVKRER